MRLNHFVTSPAKLDVTKVVSQPLQPEQLPSQQQGAIIASINVEQTFTGPGAGLMMAALLAEGALAEQVKAISASVDAANKKSNNQAVDNFLAVKASADASGKDENPTGNSESPAKPPAEPPTLAERLAALTNLDEVKRFLDTNWEKLRDEAATNFMPGLGVNSADILGADLRSAMSENARNFDPNFPDAFPLLTTVDSLPHSNANSLDPSFLPSFYQPAARSSSGSGPTNSEYLTNSNTSTSSGQTKNPVTAPNSSANSHSPANAPTPEMPPLPLGARLTMSEDTALRLTSQQLLDTAAFSAEAGQFVSLGESKHGQAWIDDKGDIRFQPETNYHGAASFSYFIRQPDGTVVEKLAAIAVENVNDAPNLAADAFIIKQGEAVFLDAFLKNDADTDGDGLVLDHIRGLEHGEIVEIDGRLAFAPALDFTGEIELSYFAKDHYDAYPSRAVVKITVLDADTAVQTTADRFLTPEGETLVINPEDIVKNDHEFDDGMINFAGLGQTLHGAVEILADGTISFRPETGYIGAEAGFYYRVSDSCGQESLGWVSVGLVDVRHAPTALAANFNIQNNESILFDAETVAQFVYDADGDALFLESISGENGAVTVDGLLYRFTPTPGFTGVTTLHYRVNDGLGGVLDGDLRITIAAVDQAVQCGADVCDAVEEQTVILQPETLVENDRDPEGGEVSFLGLGAAKFGTAILNDAGAIEFTPDKDYFGDEAGFFYQVQDEAGNVSESWVQIDLANVDDRPEIIADSLTINEDESLAFTPEVIGQFLRDGDGDTLLLTSLTVNAPPSPLAPLPQAGEGSEELSAPLPQASELAAAGPGRGVVVEKDGVFTFIAEANYHGSVALSYTARNDQGEEIAGVLNIAIAACDDATEFGTNEFVTDEETPLSIEAWTLLDAARDADGGLRFVGVGAAAHGAVAVDENGGIVFRPEANYFGEEAGFSYTLQDADGKLSENFAKIVVENVDDVPEIIADSLTINEDESLAFTPEVIGQFLRDSDGDTLLLTSLTINAPPSPPAPLPQAGEGSEELSAPLPQAGEASELAAAGAAIGVVVEKDGVFTFIPDENYSGSAALSYTAKNDKGEEISGVLNIAIAARDDATEFGLDRYDTAEEQAIILQPETLLENDHDADGALHFLGLGLTKFGTAILNDAGTIEFTPDKDYFGDEAGFFYQVQDEAGNVSESWVKITVENLNDRPEIIGDMLYLHEDQALSLTSAVLSQFLFDADGDEFHLASVSAATGGQFEEKDGIFTFIPEANYYGQAAFSYIAANESGAELVGTMTLVINPINDAPEAQITELTGLEDTEITVNIAELLAGASDIEDGDFKSGNIHFAGIDQTIHGDAWLDDDGVLHFQAEDNFSGQALLRYRVADSEGDEGFGYVKYEITGLQDAPVAVDDSLNAWSNAGYENVFQSSIFLQNDYDADGDKLSILSISAAAFGQVSLDAEGKIHYSAPATNWIGVDSFTYTIADGHGGESVAQVQFEVKANTAPDLQSEIIFSVEDIWSKIAADDLLKNDYDIDGDNLKIIKVDGAEHCQVALQADGSVKFTPDAHYNNNYPGPASFRYTVSDGVSAPVSALAYVSLSPVNDAPIVVSEELSGAVEDNYFVFHINQLTANDYDVETVSIYEEDAIILSGIWSAEYGTISWDAVSGWVYYTPDANFHGLDSFQYQIVDSEGEQDVAYSYIYVQPVNDKPFAEWDYGSPAEEEIENRYVLHGENGRGLLDNDIDIDGDVLKISGTPTVISNNAKAWLSSGDLVVLPNQGAGQVVVEYTVSDGHGGDSKSRLIIHDTPEHNSPPELVDCSAWLKSSHWVSDGYVFECTVVFNLQFMDKNGWEDIVSIDICPLETGPYSGYKKIGASSFEVQFSGDSDRGSYLPMMQFTVTATDSKNATGTVLVSFGGAAISSSQCYYGADLADLVRAHPAYSPVALDLDGDGIELLGVEAGTLFDWNGDGVAEKTGWLAVDDGFLAYDFDGDGRIAHSKEISFRDYVPGATTDLQGLAYFDDDHNGFLDPGDGQWSSFGVWRDLDGDGLSGDGEFSGLDQLGITSLHLNSDHNVSMENGNIVHGLTTYTTVDGASHIAADVGLIGAEIELVMAEDEKAADGAAEAKELIDTSCHDADEASAANPSGPGQSLAEAGSFSEKYSSQDVASSSEKSSDQDENALAAAPSSNDNVTDFANSDQTPAEAATVAPAFDEATLNNLAAQLASDMAASTWGEERLTPGPDFAAGDAGDCADDFFLHHHGLVIG